jgi:predicted transcriptional regulator of viral defense system
MTSKLIIKQTKKKLHMTLTRPIVTYVCETWTLSVRDVNNLLVFERQMLRRMYGAVQTEEGWIIRNIDELE